MLIGTSYLRSFLRFLTSFTARSLQTAYGLRIRVLLRQCCFSIRAIRPFLFAQHEVRSGPPQIPTSAHVGTCFDLSYFLSNAKHTSSVPLQPSYQQTAHIAVETPTAHPLQQVRSPIRQASPSLRRLWQHDPTFITQLAVDVGSQEAYLWKLQSGEVQGVRLVLS